MKRVLVFDSGVGGLSVLDAIVASGMAVELDYLADTAWLPYGLKPDEAVAARVPALIGAVAANWAPDIVVIACNTASTIALAGTRAAIANLPIVGVVPPIKPAAAATKTGVIGLLATPATVRRAYTNDLIAQFAADKRVVRVGSSALVEAAEAKLRGQIPDHASIEAAMAEMFGAPGGDSIDVVALSCTHFPLLGQELAGAAPRACLWVDSGAAIARRVRDLAQPQTGAARAGRAAFTDAASASALHGAFLGRGFRQFSQISSAPYFALAPFNVV